MHPSSTIHWCPDRERLCVCLCVREKENKEREGESVCQREVCAFRRAHTLLFLLKCSSSPWRGLMRYDITALCFIFKRWAGSPSLPLNEAEVPTEYMESVHARVRVRACSLTPDSYAFACVHRCGLCFWFFFFFFLHTLANTHFTHNPWHFLSWSHVSDLIGYHINNSALTPLCAPHRQRITYRRFDRLSLPFPSLQWRWRRLEVEFGFC